MLLWWLVNEFSTSFVSHEHLESVLVIPADVMHQSKNIINVNNSCTALYLWVKCDTFFGIIWWIESSKDNLFEGTFCNMRSLPFCWIRVKFNLLFDVTGHQWTNFGHQWMSKTGSLSQWLICRNYFWTWVDISRPLSDVSGCAKLFGASMSD